jgi:hypothetical protein
MQILLNQNSVSGDLSSGTKNAVSRLHFLLLIRLLGLTSLHTASNQMTALLPSACPTTWVSALKGEPRSEDRMSQRSGGCAVYSAFGGGDSGSRSAWLREPQEEVRVV